MSSAEFQILRVLVYCNLIIIELAIEIFLTVLCEVDMLKSDIAIPDTYHIFAWYVARCGCKSGQTKRHVFIKRDWTKVLKNVITILYSIVNVIR